MKKKVGWVVGDNFPDIKAYDFDKLSYSFRMRAGNIAGYLNKKNSLYENEIYNPSKKYDIVVFVKAMSCPARVEAEKIRGYGGKVVFDANVNYYDIWGDYFIPGTKPTESQREEAFFMTNFADAVVADSSYIFDIVKNINKNSFFIPDNVGRLFLNRNREDNGSGGLRLIWSGISKKFLHFKLIEKILKKIKKISLTVVSESYPDYLRTFEESISVRYIPYSDESYAEALSKNDIIVSPKILTNGYAVGHSEYKITLGMAVGLPAIASPQRSYIEAVSFLGGGFIAGNEADWQKYITYFIENRDKIDEIGRKAKETVLSKYSYDVVAREYEKVFDYL